MVDNALDYRKNFLRQSYDGSVNYIGQEVSKMDVNSLSHIKWSCKYPIVFVLKFKKIIFLGKTQAS